MAGPQDTKSDAAPWLQEPDARVSDNYSRKHHMFLTRSDLVFPIRPRSEAESAPVKPSLNASSIPNAVFSATPVNVTQSISARRPKEPRSRSTEHPIPVGDKDHVRTPMSPSGRYFD